MIVNEQFLNQNPGLEAALQTNHRIVNDIRERFFKFGHLSEKQVALVIKLATEASQPKPELPPSEYQGQVSVRGYFTLKLIRVLRFESDYTGGTYYVHLFRDEAGNDFKWTTGSRFCNQAGNEVEEGVPYRVKATVKAHAEYKGRKQTVINRVAM